MRDYKIVRMELRTFLNLKEKVKPLADESMTAYFERVEKELKNEY